MLNCPASESMITYELQVKQPLAKLAQLSSKRVYELLTNFKSKDHQQNSLNYPASESENKLQTMNSDLRLQVAHNVKVFMKLWQLKNAISINHKSKIAIYS